MVKAKTPLHVQWRFEAWVILYQQSDNIPKALAFATADVLALYKPFGYWHRAGGFHELLDRGHLNAQAWHDP